jgi:hypothetical protein
LLLSRFEPRQDVKEDRDPLPVPGLVRIGELDQLLDIEASVDKSLDISLQRAVLPEECHPQAAVNIGADEAFGLKV